MVKKHRFHFKIDIFLIDEIDKACKKFDINSRDKLINYILDVMTPVLDEIENIPEDGIIHDNWFEYDYNLYVKLPPDIFKRLKYLHFRYNTFSIGTILRRVLRLYLILQNSVIAQILSELEIYQLDRVGFSVNYHAHMEYAIKTTTRTLFMDNHFVVRNLTLYTESLIPPE